MLAFVRKRLLLRLLLLRWFKAGQVNSVALNHVRQCLVNTTAHKFTLIRGFVRHFFQYLQIRNFNLTHHRHIVFGQTVELFVIVIHQTIGFVWRYGFRCRALFYARLLCFCCASRNLFLDLGGVQFLLGRLRLRNLLVGFGAQRGEVGRCRSLDDLNFKRIAFAIFAFVCQFHLVAHLCATFFHGTFQIHAPAFPLFAIFFQ